MNNLNPNTLVFCVFGTSLGYLIGDSNGAVWGLAITSGIAFLVNLIPDRK